MIFDFRFAIFDCRFAIADCRLLAPLDELFFFSAKSGRTRFSSSQKNIK